MRKGTGRKRRKGKGEMVGNKRVKGSKGMVDCHA